MNLQKFVYDRYNKFVYTGKDENNFQEMEDLLPFVVKNFQHLTKDDIQNIKEVLKTEITKARTAKTFSTFKKVANSSRFDILVKQLLHYFTTYGLGLQGEDVFLDNPEFNQIIKEVIVIESMSFEEFVKRFVEDIYNTKQWTFEEISFIVNFINYNNLELDFDKIPSKELRYALFDKFNKLPDNIDEFFGYVNYILTGNTLFVKDEETLGVFVNKSNEFFEYLKKFIEKYGFIPLAEGFNRYKKIFVAVKANSNNRKLKWTINRISKLSKKYHKPKGLPKYLRITELIEYGNICYDDFMKLISNMDLSYVIKLGNAFKYRVYCQENNINGAMYVIRNGKIWYTKTYFTGEYKPFLEILINFIQMKFIKKIVKEKIIFDIEKYKNYALPVSGKQFLNDVPFGTKITNFNLMGIYWENVNGKSIDLDLSLTNQFRKIGWNSDWKNNNVIFSGDMTDAKNGAAESFLLLNTKGSIYILNINYFSPQDVKVPYTLWFGNIERTNELPKNTMADEIIFKCNDYVDEKNIHKTLGVLIEDTFYINNFKMPPKSVANENETLFMNVIKAYNEARLRIEDILSEDLLEILKGFLNSKDFKKVEYTKDVQLRLFS